MSFTASDLADGVRLFVYPTTKFKTVTIRAFFHRALGEGATAGALLPHVLRRGCRRTPTMRAITVFLEDLYGASSSAEVFKMGEQQVMAIGIDVINDRYAPRKIGAVRRAMEFLGRMATEPVLRKKAFLPEFVAQEKENLKRSIEGLINDRGAYAYEQCLRAMCSAEPYRHYEYGCVEDLPAITPQSLRDLHLQLLGSAPVDIYVVGDVGPKRISAMAQAAFRPKRQGVVVPASPVERPAPAEAREIAERMDVEQGNIVIGARTGVRWESDDATAMSMANGVFGAFPHSKLFVNVRERDSLAYSVHSWLDFTKGLLFIAAGIEFGKYGRALQTIREELAALQAGTISDEEMEKTRASLIDRVRSREDSAGSMIGVAHEMMWHGRTRSAEESIAAYRSITRDAVVAAARRIRLDTIYHLTRP